MDGQIDARLVMTVVGMLVSVAGAAAVARQQIKSLGSKLQDVEQRLRKMDSSSDKLETITETQEQRLNVLSKMSSPENLRRDQITLATLLADVKQLQKETDRLHAMHNGKHPPVSNERKAD